MRRQREAKGCCPIKLTPELSTGSSRSTVDSIMESIRKQQQQQQQ